MKKWIRILVPLCAVVVLIVACVNLGGIFVEYSKGAAEYKGICEYGCGGRCGNGDGCA